MMGLLSTKKFAKVTALLLPQPILTFWFYRYCAGRFESAFSKFPLQVMSQKLLLQKKNFYTNVSTDFLGLNIFNRKQW